jgi:16S rRNA (uracil1498-N3)-methyltransferase
VHHDHPGLAAIRSIILVWRFALRSRLYQSVGWISFVPIIFRECHCVAVMVCPECAIAGILTQRLSQMPNVAMSRTRIYVSSAIRVGDELWLDGERAHYLSRVMRVRPGDFVVAFNGLGGEYLCSVSEVTKQKVLLAPEEYSAPIVESALKIHLLQGISRGDRMDAVVQKATELGVHRISPVRTEFSVVRLDPERSARKAEHWQRIAQSACEQCGRNSVPVIDEPSDLPIVLGEVSGASRLVLIPGSRDSLTHLPRDDEAITLLIGPEGGFSEPESRLAFEHDFLPRSLGPRILRTETAAIAAIAILQSHFGDLANGDETPSG